MAFCPFVSKATTSPAAAICECSKGCALNINGKCSFRILAEIQAKQTNPDQSHEEPK